ncbi:unnamed protein product [Mycetohabitans rhizoxinica HKI 454]|uniref:Uncharacterized protein n=1 Tax=Mycetohabitans rhizoxinica (strain DSM 19002 / CIP 109453 / HKI 454) TaxID=882378 RepID=E5AT91_MYCRK|nr:unnamed protein product [Mycetohabitans rhizoxinica HKI 454]
MLNHLAVSLIRNCWPITRPSEEGSMLLRGRMCTHASNTPRVRLRRRTRAVGVNHCGCDDVEAWLLDCANVGAWPILLMGRWVSPRNTNLFSKTPASTICS